MSKEFKVGLIALVAGAMLYYGFSFLKGNDFFSHTSKYYVVYDNVEGLNKSNPVIVNGLAVGRVSRITLLQKQNNLILVEMDIDQSIELGDSTVASLTNTDILGSKGIVLNIGPLNRVLEPGDTVIANVDRGLNQIIESATPVANNLNTTITRVNEILIGLKGSGEKINATIGELQIMSHQVNSMLAENQHELARIMASTAVLTSNLNSKIDQLDPVLNKTSTLLDSLQNLEINETLTDVRLAVASLDETLKALRNEQGTLGKLMSNDSLYNNLNQTLVDLDKLIIHMDQYPKHFFAPLGKKHEKVMRDLNRDN